MSSNIALNYLSIFFCFKMANYLFVVNKAKEYRPGVGKVFNERAACENSKLPESHKFC